MSPEEVEEAQSLFSDTSAVLFGVQNERERSPPSCCAQQPAVRGPSSGPAPCTVRAVRAVRLRPLLPVPSLPNLSSRVQAQAPAKPKASQSLRLRTESDSEREMRTQNKTDSSHSSQEFERDCWSSWLPISGAAQKFGGPPTGG